MKKILIIACALFASFFVNATEESTVKEVNAVVPQKTSSSGVKSLPNKQGDIVEMFYREDMEDGVVALQRKGKTLYFFQYVVGNIRPIEVPPTQQILWLNDREFACVSAGRRCSYYAIYLIDDSTSPAPIPNAIEANPRAKGVWYTRIKWSVRDNTLEGFNMRGHKVISIPELK